MTPAAVAGGAGASVRHWYKIEDPEKEGDRQEFSMQGISPPKVNEDQILELKQSGIRKWSLSSKSSKLVLPSTIDGVK